MLKHRKTRKTPHAAASHASVDGAARRQASADGATPIEGHPSAEPSGAIVEPNLKSISGALSSLMLFFKHRYLPELWDYRDIAKWMKISETSVKIRVIGQPGFPQPFMPTGNEDGHRRYFSDEVIAFARKHRARQADFTLD